MKKKKNIVLIGMTGSSKTTTGKILAKKLGYGFFDSDDEIVKKYSLSIPEIFSRFGEDGFRERESKILKKLSYKSGCVISCGGGAVLRKENMKYLKRNGIAVQLYADPEILYKRINSDKNRPLTSGKTEKELKELYDKRKSLYEKYGDYKVDNSFLSPEQAAEETVKFYLRISR